MIQSDELIFFRGVGIPPTRLRDWEKSWEKLRWSWELLKPVWLPIHLETCYYDVHFHLVGGLEHGFYFPLHIWDVILPIDELIFFKMVIAPPTSLEIGYNGISMAYEGGFNQEIYNIYIYIWLVVWNMAFIFPNSWDDDPIWRTHIFQRGRYTTNQT